MLLKTVRILKLMMAEGDHHVILFHKHISRLSLAYYSIQYSCRTTGTFNFWRPNVNFTLCNQLQE